PPVAVAAPPSPPPTVEIQTPAPELPRTREPREMAGADPARRREQLKERLRAVRENPRPEPLPATVAEAGVLVVERISSLQTELHKVKALNLALTQDLEAARRHAEKATEEARLRMEESRRLSTEMQGRVKLLDELERELSALEAERDEALLALQEARRGLVAAAQEKVELEERIAEKDRSLADALTEEERLCEELEAARDESAALRRSVEALTSERETLARQVSELTAERAELLEARKALEAVHRALSNAIR
ncbi:MAG TPA: extensin-like protein, partial [Myxococcaceae bacterium]|nr:extensin-like protein [Myxococcaceae bacterium]